MLLQVHDELPFMVSEGEPEKTVSIVENTIAGAAELAVPLVVDAGHGRAWAEAHRAVANPHRPVGPIYATPRQRWPFTTQPHVLMKEYQSATNLHWG
jgi:hypothetical protein